MFLPPRAPKVPGVVFYVLARPLVTLCDGREKDKI